MVIFRRDAVVESLSSKIADAADMINWRGLFMLFAVDAVCVAVAAVVDSNGNDDKWSSVITFLMELLLNVCDGGLFG